VRKVEGRAVRMCSGQRVVLTMLCALSVGMAASALAQDQPPPEARAPSRKKGGGARASAGDPAEFDRRAAEIWVALADVKLASEYAESVLHKSFGFQDQTVSTALHASNESFKQARARLIAGPDDARRRAASDITRSATAVERYIELVTKSIASAQSKNGWAGEPNDQFSQALAVVPTMDWSEDTWRVLRHSAAFAAALPVAARVGLGLSADPAGFDFGAGVLHSDPQKVLFVRKDGVADDLGLESGDRVLSADGKTVASIWELQKLLVASTGKKIDIEVERKGKKKIRKAKVPERLPELAVGGRR
jgi:hypothetical protein